MPRDFRMVRERGPLKLILVVVLCCGCWTKPELVGAIQSHAKTTVQPSCTIYDRWAFCASHELDQCRSLPRQLYQHNSHPTIGNVCTPSCPEKIWKCVKSIMNYCMSKISSITNCSILRNKAKSRQTQMPQRCRFANRSMRWFEKLFDWTKLRKTGDVRSNPTAITSCSTLPSREHKCMSESYLQERLNELEPD